jgi:catechol 2,3-dioxygenase-like lactoylglutathione lyase family enzyme
MEMKSIAGIVCYVKDTEKTAEFYEALGFRCTERKSNHASVRLNWFWIDFLAAGEEQKEEFQKEANIEPKGGGQF